jgi:short-subunit dehydrogenase
MRVNHQTVALITGASGGLGRATARLLADRGASLILLARGQEGLEGAKREVEARGGRALVVPTDVSRFEEVQAAADIGEREFGPIDLWINNAMVSMYSPFMRMTPEEFRRIVEVTFLGSVHGTRCALERMLPRDRGVIIQVGSALAFRSIPLQSAYCASKHALQGFIESIWTELLHEKSRVQVSMVNMPALNTTQFIWTRNNLPRRMKPVGPIYQPEVGARAILFAAEHRRREWMVGYSTVEATVGEKFIPRILDRYLAHQEWEGSMSTERADPQAPSNLWEPIARDLGAHGPFDQLAHEHSPQQWLNENRARLAQLLVPAVLLLAGWIRRRRHHRGPRYPADGNRSLLPRRSASSFSDRCGRRAWRAWHAST